MVTNFLVWVSGKYSLSLSYVLISHLSSSDFLKSLIEEPSLQTSAEDILQNLGHHQSTQSSLNSFQSQPPSSESSQSNNQDVPPVVPANSTEKFLLTAADQKDGSRDERLAR
jgi:hypothetical protein